MNRPKPQAAAPIPAAPAAAPPPTPVARRPLARLGRPSEVLTYGSMGLGRSNRRRSTSTGGAKTQGRKSLGGGSGLGY
jgi:hypothetical protein